MAPPAVSEAPAPIPAELAAFLEEPLFVDVATRSGAMLPEATDATAMTVDAAQGLVTLYIPERSAGPTLANLRDNGQIAVNASRPSDHRTIQLKGTFVSERPADESERELQLRYLQGMIPRMGMIGIPQSVCLRMVYWPSRVVRFAVRDIFVQTPGPNAGRRLDVAAGDTGPGVVRR